MADLFSQNNPAAPIYAVGEQKSNLGKWLLAASLCLAASGAFTVWYGVGQYNDMQGYDERVEAEWDHVINQYTRRADLVPNLVTVVKSYAAHETTLFTEIASARNNVSALTASVEKSRDPRALEKYLEAQKQLSVPLSRLLMVAEKYPDLKASELYRDLMVQLEGTENRISYARQRHIEAIAGYNLLIRSFPTSLIAAQAGYKPRPRLATDTSALRQPIQIDLK